MWDYTGPDERYSAFDVETTGVNPEEDRIVQASIVSVSGGQPTRSSTVLIDPGVPIPDGAAEVHGITTAIAQEQGVAAKGAIPALARQLTTAIEAGRPIVGYNLPFDLTLMDRECRRHGVDPPDWSRLRGVDPLVIWKWADRFRRGSRNLSAACEAFGVELGEDAHGAAADALAAARLAYRFMTKTDLVQGRHPEIIQRRAFWKAIKGDLGALHNAQAVMAHEQAIGLRDYFTRQGKHDEAASVQEAWPWCPYEGKVAA
jgi:DNA polymerase-3 subunit epsilon